MHQILSLSREVFGHLQFQCSSILLYYLLVLLHLCWAPEISSWLCCGCSGMLSWSVPEWFCFCCSVNNILSSAQLIKLITSLVKLITDSYCCNIVRNVSKETNFILLCLYREALPRSRLCCCPWVIMSVLQYSLTVLHVAVYSCLWVYWKFW